MIFYDKAHETSYNEICSRMKSLDCYHRAVAYLLALDTVLREHTEAVFDFEDDSIKPDGLFSGSQTDTSAKTTRLAFNLWNGFCFDGETYTDKDGYKAALPSRYYTPEQLFSCTDLAPYYWQAIKIRFEVR